MIEKLKAILKTGKMYFNNKVMPIFRRAFLIIGFIVGSMAIGYITAYMIGMNLPKTYTVERLKTFNYPIETVWKELSNVETYNEWKRDVYSVEYISAPGQTPVEYMEYYRMKPSVRYQVIQKLNQTNRKVWETRIAGSSNAIKSQWYYQLKPFNKTTVMTMKQSISIDSAFDRFTAHYIDKFMDESEGFLFSLDKRLALVNVSQ